MDQEEQGKQIRLTSTEIGQLWAQYMNDSASICMLSYFLEKAEDEEIKPMIAHALELSQAHVNNITAILTEEKNKLPHGFKMEEDVDLTAPRLFSDSYVLNFIQNMAKIGLTTYSASLSVAIRADITDFYMECLSETMQLYKMSKDLLLSKGLYTRPPFFPNLEELEYVETKGFILDLFGEKRPLQALEVTNLYSNFQRNALGAATVAGFSQVSKSKDATQFFLKLIGIAKKHAKAFGAKLEESNLPTPLSWGSDVTKSTDYTFSDKLMMFYTSQLISLSIGYYGTAIAQSPRMDLGTMYNKLVLEIQKISVNGANIMIKNKWMEQPPMAPDRIGLAKKNK
ncbi:DUF3231 family protein [Halobacillus shinanisalinarum]|uniref:DUF3231 family protein n=1 Tax=Halobacillus shinanisalinarum TaxID=2932258 RepID=A0ABY4GW60_9BACI|nr:DUF3231 family protein [Halobacillus shinanisalinarum]UOQ92204.1 DUF3231 family protein [Halobacillus shinanisalinarum]